MKYVFIEKDEGELRMKGMWGVVGVGGRGWYRWCEGGRRIRRGEELGEEWERVVVGGFRG